MAAANELDVRFIAAGESLQEKQRLWVNAMIACRRAAKDAEAGGGDGASTSQLARDSVARAACIEAMDSLDRLRSELAIVNREQW